MTCLRYTVNGGTVVWIQAAWFRTSAHNHGTLLGGLGSQNLNSCSPSFSLTDSTSGSGETAPKKPFHQFSGENALLASLFFPNPPLKGHCVCKILKWLWRKNMKLWYAKNGKRVNVNFFPNSVHCTQCELLSSVPVSPDFLEPRSAWIYFFWGLNYVRNHP